MTAEDIAKALGKYSTTQTGFSAPCPAHDDKTPSLSISHGKDGKVLVHCHAGCDQGAVVDALKRRGLWPEAEKRERPAKPVRRIVATYDYVDPETGEVKMQVVRYEPKDFRQRRPGPDGGWSWSVPASERILFNLPAVKASSKTIVIVEGEKDVEALAGLGIVATCNPGGAGKWEPQFTAALAGRDILILPDNDEAGEKHLDLVGRSLTGVARSIKVLRLPDLPPKGDVSDWVYAGGTRDLLAGLFSTATEFAADDSRNVAVQERPADVTNADRTLGGGDDPARSDLGGPDTPFRTLGHNHGTYHYLALGSQQVVSLTAAAHTKGNLLGIAPLQYWEREFPGSRAGFDVDRAANALMRICEQRGIFSTNMLRGRGAWFDEGRVVLHLGNMLYVDRKPCSPVAIKSRWVYEQGEMLLANIDDPLNPSEANEFLDLVRMMPWERSIDALYVAGWCVLAHIGGVLKWRPHIWVVGSKGSGKSHVMSEVIRPVLGENCLFVVSETTEAGVRQSLRHDALPVLFDEAEGEDSRATDRLQRILALVRQSSSETGGKIAKGTSGGTAMSFNVRSCFAFSSINASLVQQSDKSRVTVVELKPDKRKYNLEQLVEVQLRVLTDEYIMRFYARAIALAPVIRKNAQTFAKAVAVVMGEQRAGDQIGALLAGAYSLRSDSEISYADATTWVSEQDWSEQKADVEGQSDEQALLAYLLQQKLRVQTDHGAQDYVVGELVSMATSVDHTVTSVAASALQREGIRTIAGHLVVSNSADGVRRMLRGTPWSVNWSKVLRRLPGAYPAGMTYFGYTGSETRSTAVPLPSGNIGETHPGRC